MIVSYVFAHICTNDDEHAPCLVLPAFSACVNKNTNFAEWMMETRESCHFAQEHDNASCVNRDRDARRYG